MAEEVKLLGTWASPFYHRIELALKLKGVQFEYIEEDLFNKSPLLLKSNPVNKRIPVLIHNGMPISDSLVILEYMDETWKDNPFLPEDPRDSAHARFWAKFIDEKVLVTALKVIGYLDIAREHEKDQAIQETGQHLELLENELKGKDLFGGDAIGYLDIAAFFIVYWMQIRQEVMGVELLTAEKFPALHKWKGKLLAMDVVKESLPPREKHVAAIKARWEAKKADFIMPSHIIKH